MTAARLRIAHVGLAAAAVALATLAAVSGTAAPGAVSAREGSVSALEVARWIRDAKPELRVIDLRDSASFDTFRIPGSERMDLGLVAHARWQPGSTVVVYGDSATSTEQARLILRAAGVRDAHVLRGGISEWVRTIAAPVLPSNPSPEQAAEWAEIAEVSRWFGGVPRVGQPTSTNADSLRAALGRIRRRGC